MLVPVGLPLNGSAFVIDRLQGVEETINNTPQVVHSVPVDELRIVAVRLYAAVAGPLFDQGGVATFEAIFYREPGGNLVRAGNTNVEVKVNGFTGGVAPQLQLNAVGNAIQLVLVGKNNQTLRWYLDLEVRRST